MYLSTLVVIVFIAFVAIGFFWQREYRMQKPLSNAPTPIQKALHFWDALDWAATQDQQQVFMAQAFPQYAALLQTLPYAESEKAIATALKGLEQKKRIGLYRYFVQLSKAYWFDPIALSTNERLYAAVLQQVATCRQLDGYERKVAQETRTLISKNNPGDLAEDFVYTLLNGAQDRLYALEAPHILLFFYNPECHACQLSLEQIRRDETVAQAIEEQQLAVLTVYVDQDVSVWKKHLEEMPAQWIHAYDKNQLITKNNTYDLKAIPTLYLLNKDKRVLLKDASWQRIASYFR